MQLEVLKVVQLYVTNKALHTTTGETIKTTLGLVIQQTTLQILQFKVQIR